MSNVRVEENRDGSHATEVAMPQEQAPSTLLTTPPTTAASPAVGQGVTMSSNGGDVEQVQRNPLAPSTSSAAEVHRSQPSDANVDKPESRTVVPSPASEAHPSAVPENASPIRPSDHHAKSPAVETTQVLISHQGGGEAPPSQLTTRSPQNVLPSTRRLNPLDYLNSAAHFADVALEKALWSDGEDAQHFPGHMAFEPLPDAYRSAPSYFARNAGYADTSVALEKKDTSVSQQQVPKQGYIPRSQLCSPPVDHFEGREQEDRRFFGKQPTPYEVPIYDQACLKYIFSEAFDAAIDPMEVIGTISFVISILTNIVSACINLANAADGATASKVATQSWVLSLSRAVFAVEFVAIIGMSIILVATLIEAIRHRNIGTDLASDTVALGQKISGFSSIRIVGWVSPGYAARLILPELQNAVTWRHYMRVLSYVGVYVVACGLAAATIILKVTQIGFTATDAIGDWTVGQWFVLIGFVLNLAKVDDSYETETKCLLNAVHRHYCRPGQPTDENLRTECLYSRLLKAMDIHRNTHYEYFEVVFDFHFDDVPPDQRTWKTDMRKFVNFLAFILRIDNKLLRQFLQMTTSPLTFYEEGRASFRKAFEEGDIVAMDMALWRSDPEDPRLIAWAFKNKDVFNLVFRCEDPDSDDNGKKGASDHGAWAVVNKLKAVDEDDQDVPDHEAVEVDRDQRAPSVFVGDEAATETKTAPPSHEDRETLAVRATAS